MEHSAAFDKIYISKAQYRCLKKARFCAIEVTDAIRDDCEALFGFGFLARCSAPESSKGHGSVFARTTYEGRLYLEYRSELWWRRVGDRILALLIGIFGAGIGGVLTAYLIARFFRF